MNLAKGLLAWALKKFYFGRKLPIYHGELVLDAEKYGEHLRESVRIVRDEFGVPHVYATSLGDVFFGQGFAMAQERMFQLEVMRRVALGQMALLDAKLLPLDRFCRIFGFHRVAKMDSEMLNGLVEEFDEDYDIDYADISQRESRDQLVVHVRYMKSFFAGVNCYLASPLYRGRPLAMYFAGLPDPEPFTLTHACAMLRLMGLELNSYGWMSKFVNEALLSTDISEEDLRILREGPFSGDPESHRVFGCENQAEKKDWDAAFDLLGELMRGHGSYLAEKAGSNAFAVSGDHTETGFPVIGADPHLNNANPSVWMQFHLVCPSVDFDARGVALVGFPGIQVGRNSHLAFGVTLALCDQYDVYREKVDVSNGTYEYDNETLPLICHEEVIAVKGEQQQQHFVETVRCTHHGPLLDGLWNCFGEDEEEENRRKFRYSIKGVSMLPLNEFSSQKGASVGGILTNPFIAVFMCLDSSVPSALKSLHRNQLANLNFVLADDRNNICHYCSGGIPIRPDTALPKNPVGCVDGWKRENEWKGFLPADENPFELNPECGFVISANHRPVSSNGSGIGYPHEKYLGQLFLPAWRATRIREMLLEILTGSSGNKVTIDDVKRIQNDRYSDDGGHLVLFPLLQERILKEAAEEANVDSPTAILEPIWEDWKRKREEVESEEDGGAFVFTSSDDCAGISLQLLLLVAKAIVDFRYEFVPESVAATCYCAFQKCLLRSLLFLGSEDMRRNPHLLGMVLGNGFDRKFLSFAEFAQRETIILPQLLSAGAETDENSLVSRAGGLNLVLIDALVSTVAVLRKQCPEEIDQSLPAEEEIKLYEYGRFHTITWESPFHALLPQLSPGPFPIGGSDKTPSAFTMWPDLFVENPNGKRGQVYGLEVCAHPSARFVASLGNNKSDVIIPDLIAHAPGQSENPSSPHYDDQVDLILKGEYREALRLTEEDAMSKFSDKCIVMSVVGQNKEEEEEEGEGEQNAIVFDEAGVKLIDSCVEKDSFWKRKGFFVGLAVAGVVGAAFVWWKRKKQEDE